MASPRSRSFNLDQTGNFPARISTADGSVLDFTNTGILLRNVNKSLSNCCLDAARREDPSAALQQCKFLDFKRLGKIPPPDLNKEIDRDICIPRQSLLPNVSIVPAPNSIVNSPDADVPQVPDSIQHNRKFNTQINTRRPFDDLLS